MNREHIKSNKDKVQYTIMSQAQRFILSQKGYKNTSHEKKYKSSPNN